ncbi:MAG: DUF4838 domain-containing protein [Victivallaceae bacterium]|jgi:hypothetical protein
MKKYSLAVTVLALFLSIASGKELIYDGTWTIETNKNPAAIGKAFDGKLETAWASDSAQEAGDYIKINFNKEVLAYAVVLIAGDKYSFPRGIEISASRDGKNWKTLSSDKICKEGEPVKISPRNAFSFSFPPSVIKYLKISLSESCGLPLKITECSIFGQDKLKNIKTDRSVIIIPQSASPTVVFAAEELQEYLGRMGYFVNIRKTENIDTAQYPDYVFKLGTSQASGLGADGFAVKGSGKDILIGGNTDISVLYGTYALLERLGIRWFCPEEDGEYVPENCSCDLLRNINLVETPSFSSRGFVEPYFWDARKVIWSVRHKVNTLSQEGALAVYILSKNSGIDKIGGRDYYYSNAGWAWPSATHSFGYFISTGKYFKDHPEYFPLINGRRVNGNSQQLCTSNPAVIEIFKKKTLDYLSTNPPVKLVAICPNDGALKWCECDNCRKLDGPEPKEIFHAGRMCRLVTDRYLVFVKEIAEAVRQKYPEAKILAFGYSVFKAPPTYVKEMPDNVILQICQYGDPAQIIGTVDDNKYTLDWMHGWAGIKGPVLRGYDYLLLREGRPNLHTPLFFTEALFHKLKLYRSELNVRDYQTQFNWSVQDDNPMLFYAYVKALWNVETDGNEFYNDFFSKYYGNASVPMEKYFRMMMKRVKDKKIIYGNNYNCPPPPNLFDAELIHVIDGLFAEADKLAGKEFIIKQRINRDREAYQYAKKCLNLDK